ncbi:MAG: hypothetical protein ACRDHW_00355 [Ktedonobacteraceae bacterium]
MFGKKHEPESITLYHYDVIEISDGLIDGETETTDGTGAHCAWCGDPPDAYGSHSICALHAAQLIEQAAARRRSRGLS